MKLSAPKNVTFLVALILAVLGILGALFEIQFLKANMFLFVLVGFVVLALGNLLKGF